jgi:hypothetical protein
MLIRTIVKPTGDDRPQTHNKSIVSYPQQVLPINLPTSWPRSSLGKVVSCW